jgi:hypothetical protein
MSLLPPAVTASPFLTATVTRTGGVFATPLLQSFSDHRGSVPEH